MSTIVSDLFAPNMYFTEFTARKLSNPRFRGIGSSPANPAVTTYFDGVPQLNTNSSSIDLMDVGQVEFVRGPQSALFGRNALGGLINVTSAGRRSRAGPAACRCRSPTSRRARCAATSPGRSLTASSAVAVGDAVRQRDGFTVNDLTGNDLDSRDGVSAPRAGAVDADRNWETRVIVNGERARDGDYALSDLGGLRANPFHAARDFEGHTNRDIFGTTVLNRA